MNSKHLAIIALTITSSFYSKATPEAVLAEKPTTVTLWPILAALETADRTFLDPQIPWIIDPENVVLKSFMGTYWPQKNHLSLFNDKEIYSKASTDLTIVNTFLRENKFNIQLKQSTRPKAFYVASILDILTFWKEKGDTTTIRAFEKEFPAISLSKNFIVYKLHQGPVIELTTKSNDMVYITPANKPREGFELLQFVEELHSRLNWKNAHQWEHYSEIIFPMVEINDYPDISWIMGLKKQLPSELFPFEVTKALQQTKFQMNEEGAAAQSAVAFTFEVTAAANEEELPLIIDQPFIVWIERPMGKKYYNDRAIVFAAYCPPSCWQKPDKLDSRQLDA